MSDNVPVNALETSLTIVETLKEQEHATLTDADGNKDAADVIELNVTYS